MKVSVIVLALISSGFFMVILITGHFLLKVKLSEVRTLERSKKKIIDTIRNEMVMDFHDQIGNYLASIITMTGLLKLKLKNNSHEILDIIDKLEHSSKLLFQGTKEFIWSIDPANDNLSEVLTYLRDFAVSFFSNTNISFHVNKGFLNQSENIRLKVGEGRHFLAIFKEAMTNILKHSKASEVLMDSHYEDSSGEFQISLSDDGVGINNSMFNKRSGGLQNMKNRAREINAQILFENIQAGGLKMLLKYYVKAIK